MLNDIARCNGYLGNQLFSSDWPPNCPLRENCARFSNEPSVQYQVWTMPEYNGESCGNFEESLK